MNYGLLDVLTTEGELIFTSEEHICNVNEHINLWSVPRVCGIGGGVEEIEKPPEILIPGIPAIPAVPAIPPVTELVLVSVTTSVSGGGDPCRGIPSPPLVADENILSTEGEIVNVEDIIILVPGVPAVPEVPAVPPVYDCIPAPNEIICDPGERL